MNSIYSLTKHLVDTYNILDNEGFPNMREEMKDFSDWPTFPQIYVGGEFYAGLDIMFEDYKSGELEKFLEENGVNCS